jgi:alkylation response protein AidB-like acyl-CoA dehydrogenase
VDLTLDAEQELLAGAARAFLERSCPLSEVRRLESDPQGFDAKLWRELADLGWTGMELPEEYGGAGQGFLEVALVLEAMGRALLPSPFLASAVVAGPLLLELGSEAQRDQRLPRLAAGEAVASLAVAEPGWRDPHGEPGLELRESGSGRAGARPTLHGIKLFVPFAPQADLLLVAAAGPSLVLVERGAPGLSQRRLATLGGDPVYELRFDATPGERVGAPGAAGPALARALARGAVGALAQALGAAERALELSLEHAKTRQQFGRPIGSFQAVAHRLVDMRSDIDALRTLVYRAAWTFAPGRESELAVASAQAYGGPALRRVFAHAHQVHGAIGFSTEHDLHLFTRRAKAVELAWGGPAVWRERVAVAMGL